jgi:hypothetical protein
MQGRNTLGYLHTRTFYTPERKYAYIGQFYNTPFVHSQFDSIIKIFFVYNFDRSYFPYDRWNSVRFMLQKHTEQRILSGIYIKPYGNIKIV